MLNPEQIRLRQYDSEVRRLKAENERLNEKLASIREAVISFIEWVKAYVPFQIRGELESLIQDLKEPPEKA